MGDFVRLGEISKIYSGGTPSRNNLAYWGGDIPWVKTAHIQGNRIGRGDIDEFITKQGLDNSSAKIVPAGTILMAMYGQGKTRGQVAVLEIEASINQACCTIEVLSDHCFEYVFQYLKSSYESIRSLSNDGGQKNLSSKIIKNFKIYLPPLPEQKAIANILQTWDTAIEKTEALIAAKERQFGWLVREAYRQIKNSEISKAPLCEYLRLTSCTHGNKAANIAAIGKKGIRDRSEIYSKELSGNYSKNKLVYGGEIAFGLANDCMVYGVNFSRKIYSVSPAYKTFRIINCDSTFLKYWLDVNNARFSLKYLITSARQGKSVDFKGLLKEKVVAPNLEEQKRIAGTLNTARHEIDLLSKLTEQYRAQKRGLMQKLLTGEWNLNS